LIAYAISCDFGIPLVHARKNIFLIDSKGLVYKNRPSGGITDEKAPFAHELVVDSPLLEDIVRAVKPTALIGGWSFCCFLFFGVF
jgi:malate dehydrogenase (oxaloacetate-decarboxylating)(NADP+)